MNSLKILNLATTTNGGAGIATLYLNEMFNKAGHNSKIVVKHGKKNIANVITIESKFTHFLQTLKPRVKSKLQKLYPYSRNFVDEKYRFYNLDVNVQMISARDILKKITFSPDVILLHWVSNFINSNVIKDLVSLTGAKIVWLMMDNAPITGGCHYPWDCTGFHSDCAECPAILDDSYKGIAKKKLELKKQFLPSSTEVIALSENDFRRLKASSLFHNKKKHKVLSPIYEDRFCPSSNKKKVKQEMNIPESKKIIFYGSILLEDSRKGGKEFCNAITELENIIDRKKLALDEILIMIAGKNNNNLKEKDFKIPIKTLGYLDESDLIKAYQVADIFVSTSLEDSGPLMINQAIMSGTPVVSFNTGVAQDLVIANVTGYHVPIGDYIDLAKGLKYILEMNNCDYTKLSEQTRSKGLELMNYRQQINKFIKIFRN